MPTDHYVDLQDQVRTTIDHRTQELVLRIHTVRQHDLATIEDLGWQTYRIPAVRLERERETD